MSTSTDFVPGDDDPFDLNRFLGAQEESFARALSEIRSGRKRTHWMWFIFPQCEGLSFSSTSQHYSIKSVDEAKSFLAHPVLGARLIECAEALLSLEGPTANEIFGDPDDLKVRSCATLFAQVSPLGSVFERVLEKYYEGESDPLTLELMDLSPDTAEISAVDEPAI